MRNFDVRFTSAPVENWTLRRIGLALELAGGRVPSRGSSSPAPRRKVYPGTGVTAACAQSPRVSMFVTLAVATSVTTPFPFTE